MQRWKWLILVSLICISSISIVQAQTEDEPPYLYYYSRMLGGIIIERADGTDSRLLGADVIPPGIDGLSGPGWSPSGRYFAAQGFNYGDYNASSYGAYVIDTQGNKLIDWLDRLSVRQMQWSPIGEDWLFIIGSTAAYTDSGQSISFLLLDAAAETVLVGYVENFALWPYEWSGVMWEPEQEQVRFYIAPEIYSDDQFFQVIMRFDGTVLKEPVTEEEYQTHYLPPNLQYDDSDLYDAHGVSPSGRYEASGKYPTRLHDLNTGRSVELPTHSQGTICRGYEWSADEGYIITLDGTLRAGGGCGWAVLGVTDKTGELWRELGNCTWGPPCIGWLPSQVDVSGLPSGQPESVQLDPITYEPGEIVLGWDDTQTIRLRCEGEWFNIIVDQASDEPLFRLQPDEPCPYGANDSFADVGLQMTFAYNPHHELLATYFGQERPVSIWTIQDGIGTHLLRLNTYGYELEFTEDGEYLRARNVNGWKVYAVADILAAIDRQLKPVTG